MPTHTPWLAYLSLATSMALVGSYVGLSKLLVRQLLQQGVAVERAAEGGGFASARDMRRVWAKFEPQLPGQVGGRL